MADSNNNRIQAGTTRFERNANGLVITGANGQSLTVPLSDVDTFVAGWEQMKTAPLSVSEGSPQAVAPNPHDAAAQQGISAANPASTDSTRAASATPAGRSNSQSLSGQASPTTRTEPGQGATPETSTSRPPRPAPGATEKTQGGRAGATASKTATTDAGRASNR